MRIRCQNTVNKLLEAQENVSDQVAAGFSLNPIGWDSGAENKAITEYFWHLIENCFISYFFWVILDKETLLWHQLLGKWVAFNKPPFL